MGFSQTSQPNSLTEWQWANLGRVEFRGGTLVNSVGSIRAASFEVLTFRIRGELRSFEVRMQDVDCQTYAIYMLSS